MPRFKLTVAYDGTHFHGWQKQHPPDAVPLRTAQGVLEEAVRAVVRQPINVFGASRTDSGVHACGQVAAFDADIPVPIERLPAAITARLPDDIQVLQAEVVPDAFNVIGDVEAKGYRYSIAHGRKESCTRPLFDRHWTAWTAWPLDIELMRQAARDVVGRHDFAAFTRVNHARESTIREVHACEVTASHDARLHIDVSGEGFLWNMVRIIAGTLVEIGAGRRAVDSIPATLASGDRAQAGATFPPEGLCLEWIRYGEPGCGRQKQLARQRHGEA
ncbi:MAG: tRNA pseudouridine(38-40) synthase TruA [Phycisphaerales bacterium]|nr:tRNA pseudouridine(38-40) synthase TruA [Phycisphaerales bacterium]